MPDADERQRAWATALDQERIDIAPAAVWILADRFRLTGSQIAEAAATASGVAAWRRGVTSAIETASLENGPDTNEVTLDDLFAAARLQSGQELGPLATRIEPQRAWTDLVLPDDMLAQLREIGGRVAQRRRVLRDWGFDARLSLGKGTTALFAGPSGTGKTLAAEVLARELGLDLHRIDLAGVVSKYIGETEKNLDRIFVAAETANAILFFDEADALFGKRSEVRDSHDRYANLEIAYLLQKMEQYEGVVILATNLRANLDDAFLRRLAFVVQFPFPDEILRRRIWSAVWPSATPLAPDVDLDSLARDFKLTGGHIRNVALAAAFLAAEAGEPVNRAHLLHAIRRELQKLGAARTGSSGDMT
jgi:SpoVK/Ycf46/Vps4 family AAA+-type ATPase